MRRGRWATIRRIWIVAADTQHVRIDGGNHSQFGSYGFQPGDWPATISRDDQQRQTLDAVLDMLRRVSDATEREEQPKI
jgi:hypothetical protein